MEKHSEQTQGHIAQPPGFNPSQITKKPVAVERRALVHVGISGIPALVKGVVRDRGFHRLFPFCCTGRSWMVLFK